METLAAPYVLGPGQERSHPGTWPMIKAGAADTGGAVTVVLGELGPWQSGPPLHVHYHEDETMYVLEGRLLVQIGVETHTLDPGSFVWLPRRTPHTFANAGPVPVRMFGTTVPGGIEEFFAATSAYLASLDGPPDPAEFARLAGDRGKVLGPPISAAPASPPSRPVVATP
ncbi:MAG TPA: cupin domain-containing protein [Actinomycetota bacterium]|nr:cupin domain-containing protein [Actinomycetota bacterium]